MWPERAGVGRLRPGLPGWFSPPPWSSRPHPQPHAARSACGLLRGQIGVLGRSRWGKESRTSKEGKKGRKEMNRGECGKGAGRMGLRVPGPSPRSGVCSLVGLLATPWDCRRLGSGPLGPWQAWLWQWVPSRTPLSQLSAPPGPQTAVSLPRLWVGLSSGLGLCC